MWFAFAGFGFMVVCLGCFDYYGCLCVDVLYLYCYFELFGWYAFALRVCLHLFGLGLVVGALGVFSLVELLCD